MDCSDSQNYCDSSLHLSHWEPGVSPCQGIWVLDFNQEEFLINLELQALLTRSHVTI